MKIRIYSVILLAFLSLAAGLVACQNDHDSDNDHQQIDADVPQGSALIVDKNFQSSGAWPMKSTTSIGFADGSEGCDAADILAASEATAWEEIYYNGVNNDTVLVDYTDVAVSTTCADGSGLTADGETVSSGFVLFPAKTTRSSTVTPTMELLDIKTVSVVQFTLTSLSDEGKGLALYQSVDGAAYQLVGTYKPESTESGAFYSVAINESNVSLKFVSEDAKNDVIRLHDLQVWTSGVSDDAKLYVNEFFGNWALEGYVLPVPGVEANKTGTQYVPLARSGTFEYTNTVTYLSGTPVTYTIHDGAVNPDCYNHHGDTTLVYQLTTGYIELPINNSSYANTDINASVTILELPSVSLLEFWMAVTGYSGRYQVWKSVNGGDYELFQDITVARYAGIGKYFRFYVNEQNVSFKFTTYQGTGAYTTTPKLYGVRIWSE